MIWFKETRPEDYDYLREIKRAHQNPPHRIVEDLQAILANLNKTLKEVTNA
jgi:hypothetical protein